MNTDAKQRRPRPGLLATLFVAALVLGPGPGSTLVDGRPGEPNFVLGIPALYLWLVLWFAVMAGCVVTAARTLWIDED